MTLLDARAHDVAISLTHPHTDADIIFRALDEADIPVINGLYADEYGDYPYPLTSVRPDVVYVVAESAGEIVGFARASPYDGYPHVFDLGGLIVRPAWRRRHVAKRLTEARLVGVLAAGGVLSVSEPVCYRMDCASQQNLIDRGFMLTGMLPFKVPRLHVDILGDQPETLLVAARALLPGRDTGLGTRRLFLPGDLPDLLSLFLPRSIRERGFRDVLDGPMPDQIEHKPYVVDEIQGSYFVDIPANWSEAEAVILAYIAVGYRFAGILPGFGVTVDGRSYDLVRLFKPPEALHFTFDKIHVADPLARLHAFMAREYDPNR